MAGVKITAVVEALVASGASPDTILAAVSAIESQQVDALERRREADRNRQAKRRVTLGHVTSERSRSHVRVVDNPSNSEIEDSRKEDKKAPAAPTPRDELAAVLDDDHVEAVIDHRKGFKGKFNARAAHLLAVEFAKCPDPNAAVDEMIRRNWQGFKAEWVNGQQRGHDPPRNGNGRPKSGMMDTLAEMLRDDDDGQRENEAQGDWGAVRPRCLPASGAGGH